MMSQFEEERRRYDAEVDALAAQYLRGGASPSEALHRARADVERRRRDEARAAEKEKRNEG